MPAEGDRQQLLPVDRPFSLSSKNTGTTKAQIRSGSIACNRQYAANPVSNVSKKVSERIKK
ncbi:hypothetical protein QUA82_07030 [Microcoleus sp. F8-D3]